MRKCKYRTFFMLPLLCVGLLSLTACGEVVDVPPAHKGKILTENGYKPETIPPSKFRLDHCFWYCDKLAIVETSDKGMKESFKLFMPKDQLNMSFDIRFTMSISDDEQAINSIFARMTPKELNKGIGGGAHSIVSADDTYFVYGQPILREKIRSVVAKYTINEVASSREVINAELFKVVSAALKGTPITVKRLAFGDLQFPEVIINAKIKAAQRAIMIEEERAKKQVMLVTMESKLEEAKADRAVRREKAEAAKEENQIFSESVTDKYLKYKSLEVLEKMAESPNTVFVPMSALDDVGMSQRIFNSK